MRVKDHVMKYEEVVELFEAGNYDAAVAGFISIYQSGNMQEQIVEDLYNCFILPNEEEFRSNYEDNQFGQQFAVPFEQLAIDFIPVTQEKFYLYDKIKQEFLGYIDLLHYYKASNVRTFESLCIADQWDLREILSIYNSKKWNETYIVLEECERYFMSFLKLPGIKKYLQNVMLFATLEDMEQFFLQSTEAYLPKRFYVSDESTYRDRMDSIHKVRILNTSNKSSQIFLSICIPTYNRGSIAIQTIRHLLELEYDYEIEIVVSNNGSIQDMDGYEELKQIQDSRIKYFEFEEGQGYASNIRKVLELAEGAYAVAASDEDMMELEQFPRFLNYIMEHPDSGIIFTSGIGSNFLAMDKEEGLDKGHKALKASMNANYLTGITYNMNYLRKKRVIPRFDSMRGNVFLEYYAHIVLAAMTGEDSEARYSNIQLWNSDIIEEYRAEQHCKIETSVKQEKSKVQEYAMIESRIEQQNSAIEFLMQEIHIDMQEMIWLIMDRMTKTYYLLGITYKSHYNSLKQQYRWIDICMLLYKNNLSLLDTSLKWFRQDAEDSIISLIDLVFMGFYNDNSAISKLTYQESIQEKMLCLMIEYRYKSGQALAQMNLMEFTKEIQNLLEKE